MVNSNIAAALLTLRRPAEAESAARRSVDLDGTNSRARYLLAVALVEQGKLTLEVEKSLRHAANDLPAAHLSWARSSSRRAKRTTPKANCGRILPVVFRGNVQLFRLGCKSTTKPGVRQPVARPDRPTPREISV